MQFSYLLLAFVSQCALSTAAAADKPLLEKFTLDNGDVMMLDPSSVTPAFHPGDSKRGGDSAPVSPKQIFKRACPDPAYPVGCQNGNLCCQSDDLCCENRSCIDPDVHNCCLYGYYCNKPAQCIKLNNGNIVCRNP